ncbi:D-site 20S pre-rRNA nuclease [Xylariomycetidae sp. FL0641]|nr:D-site 20S pre-rRNA nuclease [Xylariomycetidae sp. FL0641]
MATTTEPQPAPELAQAPTPTEVPTPPTESTSTTTTDATTSTPATAAAAAADTTAKPIHALVLDAGPLIKNDPPASALLARAHALYTLPSVLGEIRDAATRARVATQLEPFVTLRAPRAESVRFVAGFARRTGDLEVLSRPDLHLLALAYELECERNGGDWRLRKTPAQKGVNGRPPAKEAGAELEGGVDAAEASTVDEKAPEEDSAPSQPEGETPPTIGQETVTQALDNMSLSPSAAPTADFVPDDSATAETKAHEEEDDDDEGWITPSNLSKHKAKDQLSAPEQPIQRFLQAAILTSDYAMQNVALRMNLNLVSPSLSRITRVKTWVLRCHGCFQVTRAMDKQFCPRCGQPTLTRVSCSTDASGNFQVHLKKNFQWNNRGNVYSVPKPVHGSASGKNAHGSGGGGGGKNGWGRELIFAEDQKEYVRKTNEERKAKARDLMDEDYLPGILTGHRSSGPGRVKVGAGRNVNAKKRR